MEETQRRQIPQKQTETRKSKNASDFSSSNATISGKKDKNIGVNFNNADISTRVSESLGDLSKRQSNENELPQSNLQIILKKETNEKILKYKKMLMIGLNLRREYQKIKIGTVLDLYQLSEAT